MQGLNLSPQHKGFNRFHRFPWIFLRFYPCSNDLSYRFLRPTEPGRVVLPMVFLRWKTISAFEVAPFGSTLPTSPECSLLLRLLWPRTAACCVPPGGGTTGWGFMSFETFEKEKHHKNSHVFCLPRQLYLPAKPKPNLPHETHTKTLLSPSVALVSKNVYGLLCL